MLTMRVISWNISHQGNMGKKIALIKQLLGEAETSERPCMVSGKIKKRYDYIMVSPQWDVVDVQYRYKEAIRYGCDYAVVAADLERVNFY